MPTLRTKGKGSCTNTAGTRFSLELADSFLRRRNSNATIESRQSNSTEAMSDSSRRRISLDVPWWRSKSGSYINVRATDFIDVGVSRFSTPPANPTLAPTPAVARPRPPSVEFRKADDDGPIEVVPPPTFVKPDDDRLQRLEDAGLRRIPNERDSLPAEEFILTNPDYDEDPTVRKRISWHDPAAAAKPPANDILWPRPERPHLVTPAYNRLPPPPSARCFYPSPPPLPTPPVSEQFSLSERDSFDPDYYYDIRTSITSERFSLNSDFSGFRQQLSINSDTVFSEQGNHDVAANVAVQQRNQPDDADDEDSELGTDSDSEMAVKPELDVEPLPVVEKYESEVEEVAEVGEGPDEEAETEAANDLMNDLVDEIVSEIEHKIGKTENLIGEEELEPEMEAGEKSESEPDVAEVSQSDTEEEEEDVVETEPVTEELEVDSDVEEAAGIAPDTKSEADSGAEVPNASSIIGEAEGAAAKAEPKTDDEKDKEVQVKEAVEEETKPVAKEKSVEEPEPASKEESEPKTPTKSTKEAAEKESKSTGKLMKRASNYNRLFNRSLTPLPAARTKSRSRLPQMLSRLLDPTETETAPHNSPRKRQFGSRRVSKGALARLKSRRSLDAEPASLESISDENSSRLMNGRFRLSPKASRQSAPTPPVAGDTASAASLDFAAVSVASSDEEYVPNRMA